MATVNPFIHYNGNCLEAFEHYQKAFGGEFQMLMRYRDAPGADPNAAGGERIVHIGLPMDKENHLQGSDFPLEMGNATIGNNMAVSVNTKSEEESSRIFDVLCEGGKVTLPLGKTFWSPCFGMCVDKFGVSWMLGM